jgi:hypothetical protein
VGEERPWSTTPNVAFRAVATGSRSPGGRVQSRRWWPSSVTNGIRRGVTEGGLWHQAEEAPAGGGFSHHAQGGGIWPDGAGMPDPQPQAPPNQLGT